MADDEEALTTLFAAPYRSAGYKVREAFDGEQALGAFLDGPDSYELLIADVRMPFFTSLDLAKIALSPFAPDLRKRVASGGRRPVGFPPEAICKRRPDSGCTRNSRALRLRATLRVSWDGPAHDWPKTIQRHGSACSLHTYSPKLLESSRCPADTRLISIGLSVSFRPRSCFVMGIAPLCWGLSGNVD